MTLPDTSAWVEFMRGTGSPAHVRLRELVAGDEPLATTGPVLGEMLAGVRNEFAADEVRRALAACVFIPTEDPTDYEGAAAVYRRCRAAGVTVESSADCLIAAVAIRAGLTVLHRDADFDRIAGVLGLRVDSG